MKILLYLSVFLQLLSISCNAQSKKLTIQVYDKDSLELDKAEVKVITTTGDENIYITNENGTAVLEFSCDVGYYITIDFKGHHKEKIKLMKPCIDLDKERLDIYMKSNLISH